MKRTNVFTFSGFPPDCCDLNDDVYVQTITIIANNQDDCERWLDQNGWFGVEFVKRELALKL